MMQNATYIYINMCVCVCVCVSYLLHSVNHAHELLDLFLVKAQTEATGRTQQCHTKILRAHTHTHTHTYTHMNNSVVNSL